MTCLDCAAHPQSEPTPFLQLNAVMTPCAKQEALDVRDEESVDPLILRVMDKQGQGHEQGHEEAVEEILRRCCAG